MCADSCGVSHRFQWLSPTPGQVIYVLLTRSPLSGDPKIPFTFDLHVLSTPPAFILSQDQTLRCSPNPVGRISTHTHRFRSSRSLQHSDLSFKTRALKHTPASAWLARHPQSVNCSWSLLPSKGSKSAFRNLFLPVSPESQIRSHYPKNQAFSNTTPREKGHAATQPLKQHSQLSPLTFLTGPHTFTALTRPSPHRCPQLSLRLRRTRNASESVSS